ncbi:MAG: hypothetical protein ACI9IP_002914 [Arcticibacterium sp.]|jgi:hypothetical protein
MNYTLLEEGPIPFYFKTAELYAKQIYLRFAILNITHCWGLELEK